MRKLKDFRESANVVHEFSSVVQQICQKKNHEVNGCGSDAVEELMDELSDEYTAKSDAMMGVLATLNSNAEALQQSEHASANECMSKEIVSRWTWII